MNKNLFYLFTLLSILLLQDCIMYHFYAISFAGYYSDLILFWLWLSASIAVIIVFWRKILAKTFLVGLIITLAGSLLLMMIPFYAFVLSMTNLGLKFHKNINVKYRVQVVGYSVMTHPWLEIIEKTEFLKRRYLNVLRWILKG